MTLYHTHHIIPKHAGGTDEEHADAHKKLYEQYGKIEDLWSYQLLLGQISVQESFKLVLTKNAKDTHRKQKERGTGTANSAMQSAKGKLGAAKAGLGKVNSPNYIRVCCTGCKKETTMPTFKGWHDKNCFRSS
jgi:hypothetical protein